MRENGTDIAKDLNGAISWTNVARQRAWDSLPSFNVNPKKTFFGLDKTESHCFTLPKSVYDDYIRYFGLREGRLQAKISFEISGKRSRVACLPHPINPIRTFCIILKNVNY